MLDWTPMKRYPWDSAEYAEAFATLLRSYRSRDHLYAVLRDLLAPGAMLSRPK